MVGMLIGISALTTIGLRRYYAEQLAVPPVQEVCDGKSRCKEFSDLLRVAGIAQEHAVFWGAAGCAVVAAVLALVLFRGCAPTGSARARSSRRMTSPRSGRPRTTDGSDSLAVVDDFDDLLQANRAFADSFDLGGFDGKAHAGIAIVTCMDSRIDPLRMLGLKHGDAKIFRNPGGRVTPQALEALVLGVHLLGVTAHPGRAAHPLRDGLGLRGGAAGPGRRVRRRRRQLAVVRCRHRPARAAARGRRQGAHPPADRRPRGQVGGFIYDVDTGLLTQHA